MTGYKSDMQVLLTLSGTLEKGGPTIILEFSTEVQGNPGHDKAQSYFIYISPSQYGFQPNLISTENYDQEKSNGTSCKEFGGELTEDIWFY